MFLPESTFAKRYLAAGCLGLAGAALALATATSASAQTTYKCGSTYSQNPCEGGVALDTNDKRTADQKKQAINATQKEKQVADNLEQARLHEEKRAAAELKKSNSAKKQASPAQGKTTFRPIKNKKMKAESGEPAEKSTKKPKSKNPPQPGSSKSQP